MGFANVDVVIAGFIATAASGRRIVIDGTQADVGTVSFYTGLAEETVAGHLSVTTAAGPEGYLELAAPDLGGGTPKVTLTSAPAGAACGALLDGGAGAVTILGTTACEISADLITISTPSEPIAVNGGSLDVQNHVYSAAAQSGTATANTAAIAPGGSATVCTATIAAEAGREYTIVAHWHGLTVGAPVAFPGCRVTMAVRRGATQIGSERVLPGNTTLTQEGGTITTTDTPGAGNITYSLVMIHEGASTAGTVTINASAVSPATIYARGLS